MNIRSKHTTLLISALCFLTLTPTLAAQEEADSLKDALAEGDPSVDLRYRYEFVGDDAFDENAHASTLRTAVGYRTLPFRGFSVFLQAQNVTDIGDDKYSNRGAGHLANDVSDRPVVADPSQTRMQQVYLRLDALETSFDFGRREIWYGDHRFIGDVRWRQNHQAFDAIYLANKSVRNTTLSYTYADKVIRIFGDEQDMGSHFINAMVTVNPDVSLELFGYLLDYDDERDARLSSQTYGAKIFGGRPLSSTLRLLFEGVYAAQKDFGNNPVERDADYWHLMGGVGLGSLANVKLGRELLGSSRGEAAFQTPLATGHKFNGWADKFLATPREGLVDWYLSLDGKFEKLAWVVVYHDFTADLGDASYGTELDAQLTYPLPWGQALGFKLALYREDGFSTDTSKIWLWTQYSF